MERALEIIFLCSTVLLVNVDLSIIVRQIGYINMINMATCWSLIALLVMVLFGRYDRIRVSCAVFVIQVDVLYRIFYTVNPHYFYSTVYDIPYYLIDHMLHTFPLLFAVIELIWRLPNTDAISHIDFVKLPSYYFGFIMMRYYLHGVVPYPLMTTLGIPITTFVFLHVIFFSALLGYFMKNKTMSLSSKIISFIMIFYCSLLIYAFGYAFVVYIFPAFF